MAEFTPTQLDTLEDALARLSGPVPEALSQAQRDALDPDVATRLDEYDELLRASRDEYVDEDVPEGALAGVLAEARAAVATGAQPARAGAWSRWRAVLIPGFVLAGSTAAVLLFMRPEGESPADVEVARSVVGPDAKDVMLPPTPAADSKATPPTTATQRDDAVDEDPAPPTSEAMPVTEPAPTSKTQPKKTSATKTAPAPAPSPTAVEKDEGWDELQRAHTLRRRGDCARAAKIYQRLADSTLGEAGRAQALGGLGLCQESDDPVAAQRRFSEARRLTPEIDRWIGSQRDDGGSSTESKNTKPSAKKKARKSAVMVDAFAEDPIR